MGKRLHSAVSYEVKYGDKACFNWQADRINQIIDALAEGDTSYNDDDIRLVFFIGFQDFEELAYREALINAVENKN